MSTKWKDAFLSEYQIHNMSLAESGYNYYLYINSRGDAIIMREKTDNTGILYADAGRGTARWANRIGLDYTTYDRLA